MLCLAATQMRPDRKIYLADNDGSDGFFNMHVDCWAQFIAATAARNWPVPLYASESIDVEPFFSIPPIPIILHSTRHVQDM